MAVGAEILVGAKVFHGAARLGALTFPGAFGKMPETDSPPTEGWIQINGQRLHTLEWPGEGIPVVLLHGLNSNAWTWARLGGLLGAGRPVVAVTMPGHGRSAPPPDFTTPSVVEFLLPFLHLVAPDEMDLVGHSWGGKVALALAARLGTRCRSVTLADPVLPAGLNPVVRALPAVASAIFAPERGPFQDRTDLENTLRSLLYLQNWGDVEQRMVAENFYQSDDGSWRHRLPDDAFREILFGSLAQNTDEGLAQIECPVLLLRPTLSVSFLPGEISKLRQGLKQLSVRRISGDHVFILTNPIDSARLINRFFDRVDARP